MLPPKVTVDDGVSADELKELCYQYRYDYRNRLIEKKVPGKGIESMIYNKLDQLIMTQDANQKAKDEWSITKYDAFGRIAYTGIITDTRERNVIQEEATSYADTLWVVRGDAVRIGEVDMFYTDGGYPKAINGEVLTINYYDDYEFLGTNPSAEFVNPTTVYGQAITNKTKTLATGSKVKVLGKPYWTTSVMYYDAKGQSIYVVTNNEYLNAIDSVETKLDFVGKVEQSKTTHIKDGNTPIVTVDTFEYDHMGRQLNQKQTINGQGETIVENSYDALGQLTSKTVGGGLQDIKYDYNVRGWLTSINKGSTANGALFGFALGYNTGANPLYNGNISKTSWQTANDNIVRSYEFTYDALNRLLSATSNDNKYDMAVQYDKMGNITTLNRNGWQNTSNFFWMDVMSYSYDQGNKLLKVTDTGNSIYGFRDGANTNDDFEYDDNGNMKIDRNKGITGITYNHLNLPETVSISNSEGTGNISYIYDATGAKLKKIVTEGSSLITEYAGKYVYRNSVLQYMSTPEGYATPEGTGYRYVYQFKDHLENVRLSYTKNDSGNLEIIEESNYYPFGLKHKGYNSTVSSLGNSTAQLLGFGGKEEQDELGLGWIDITARNYDPALGRWMNPDPLAEQMRRHSPYNYAFDNPIYFIDPDGMKPFGGGNPKKKLKKVNSAIRTGLKVVTKYAKKVESFISSFAPSSTSTSSSSSRSSEKPRVGSAVSLEGDNPSASNALDAQTVVSENPEDDLTISNADIILEVMQTLFGMKKPSANGDKKTDASSNPNKRNNFNKVKDGAEKVSATGEGIELGGEIVDATMENQGNEEPAENTLTVTSQNGSRKTSKTSTIPVTETQSVIDSTNAANRGNSVIIHRPTDEQ